METLRRLTLVALYVFSLVAFGWVMDAPIPDTAESAKLKITWVGMLIAFAFIVHKTINWVFQHGEQKKGNDD